MGSLVFSVGAFCWFKLCWPASAASSHLVVSEGEPDPPPGLQGVTCVAPAWYGNTPATITMQKRRMPKNTNISSAFVMYHVWITRQIWNTHLNHLQSRAFWASVPAVVNQQKTGDTRKSSIESSITTKSLEWAYLTTEFKNIQDHVLFGSTSQESTYLQHLSQSQLLNHESVVWSISISISICTPGEQGVFPKNCQDTSPGRGKTTGKRAPSSNALELLSGGFNIPPAVRTSRMGTSMTGRTTSSVPTVATGTMV